MNKEEIIFAVGESFTKKFPNNLATISVKERRYSEKYSGTKRPYIVVIETDLNSIDLPEFKSYCFKGKTDHYSIIFPDKRC